MRGLGIMASYSTVICSTSRQCGCRWRLSVRGVQSATIDVPVSTRRIFHTILDWAGLGSTDSLRGDSAEVVLGEAMKPYMNYGWQPQIMATSGPTEGHLRRTDRNLRSRGRSGRDEGPRCGQRPAARDAQSARRVSGPCAGGSCRAAEPDGGGTAQASRVSAT